MIERLSDFMSGSSSLYVTTQASLLAKDIVVVEMFLICLVTSQDYVIKRSYDYMGEIPGTLVVEICWIARSYH